MNGAIAPHAGAEVRLVMNGTKPLATIEFDKDSSGYAMAVCLIGAGMLRGTVAPSADCDMGEVVFVKPGNRHLLEEYVYLQTHGIEQYGRAGYHRAMGRLFGYSAADIEAFIASEVSEACQCSKCQGRIA